MNNLNQMFRIVAKFGLCSFIFFLPISNTGCSLSNPPVNGIRVEALAVLATSTGLAQPPIPNCPNSGNFVFQLPGTPPGAGTDFNFSGVTNAAGISDYPNARVNARWTVIVGPTLSPPCLSNIFSEDVPAPGAAFHYFCQL